ncbi:hypothetical protein GGG16DRAFT_123952 [Schizophyllum commune]
MARSSTTAAFSSFSSSPHNVPPFYRRARENKASNRLPEVESGSRNLRRSTESGEQSQKMQEDDVEIKAEDDEDVDQLMSTEDHRDGDGRERSATNGGTPVLHFQLQRASLAPSESQWSGSSALDGVEIAQDEPLGGAFTRSPGPALVIGPAIRAMYACRQQSCELDVGDTCAVKRVLNRPPRFMWFKNDQDNDDSDSDVPEGTQEESAGDGDRFMKEDDEDYMYARVFRPLFREGDTQDKSPNSIPNAAGALVHLYMRCPSDISNPCIEQVVRYPQLIKFSYAEPIEIGDIIGPIPRIVDQSVNGTEMLPIESNDLWSSLTSDATTDIQLALICLEDGCKFRRLWEPAKNGQIRYCRKCKIWLHVACVSEQPVTVGDIRRRDLVRFDQGHMSYVLDPGARKRDEPEIKKLVLGIPGNADFDIDVEDTLNRFPIPRSLRYEEVACLPIRRRTRPGFAPETNELFYQHAIDMVNAGEGRKIVRGADVAAWLEGKAPGLGTRALKFILRKDLRKLRKDTIRRFLCTSCNAQII